MISSGVVFTGWWFLMPQKGVPILMSWASHGYYTNILASRLGKDNFKARVLKHHLHQNN